MKVIAKPSQTKLTIEANNIFKFIANKVAWYVLVLAIVYRNIACHRCFKLQCIFWQSAPLCRNIMRLMQRIHTHTLGICFCNRSLFLAHSHYSYRNVLEYLYTNSCYVCMHHSRAMCVLCVCAVQNGNDCWNVFNMRAYLK